MVRFGARKRCSEGFLGCLVEPIPGLTAPSGQLAFELFLQLWVRGC
jgi:hypothetical protein